MRHIHTSLTKVDGRWVFSEGSLCGPLAPEQESSGRWTFDEWCPECLKRCLGERVEQYRRYFDKPRPVYHSPHVFKDFLETAQRYYPTAYKTMLDQLR